MFELNFSENILYTLWKVLFVRGANKKNCLVLNLINYYHLLQISFWGDKLCGYFYHTGSTIFFTSHRSNLAKLIFCPL